MLKKVIFAACVVGGGAFAMRGCLSPKAPDAKLAGQFEDLCKIAMVNIDSPVRGVKAMGAFLKRNTSDMLAELGDIVVLVESASEADHDRRAIEAHERIAAPLRACQEDLMDFADAVDNNPEAKQIHDRALDSAVQGLLLILGGEPNNAIVPLRELAPLLRRR